LRHESKKGFESLNTFNSLSFLDSLAQNPFGFNVVTLEVKRAWKKLGLHAEIGAGNYFSPDHDLGWAEAVNLKLNSNPALSKIPVELHYFRIAPEVINNNALFWNTAIVEASSNTLPAGTAGSNATLNPFSSSMIAIGQMTNNRTGFNINAEIEIKKLKMAVGYGVSSEIEARSNTITLSHAVNQLTRSRFWRWNFTPEVGPYNRYNVVYRDAYSSRYRWF